MLITMIKSFVAALILVLLAFILAAGGTEVLLAATLLVYLVQLFDGLN